MEILDQLREPFPASDIEWRVMRSGKKNGKIWAKVYAYVQARAIQNRLDEVFGVYGWQVEYKPVEMIGIKKDTLHGFLCTISILDGDKWVKKTDGSEITEFEPFKGGISGSFKRTASAGLCIGRYLYDQPTLWADINDNGRYFDNLKIKDKKDEPFHWDPPSLPSNALPSNHQEQKGLNPGMVKNIETLSEKLWGKDWVKQLDKILNTKYKGKVTFGTYPKKLTDEQGLMICTGLKEAIAKKDGVNPADVQNSLKNTQDLERMDDQGMSDLFLETLRDELNLTKKGAAIHAGKMALQTHSKEYDKLNKDEIRTLLLEVMKKDKSFDRTATIEEIVELIPKMGGEIFEEFKRDQIGDNQFNKLPDDNLIKFLEDMKVRIKK